MYIKVSTAQTTVFNVPLCWTVASIQLIWGRGKLLSLTGKGTKGRSQRPKEPRAGRGVLGEGRGGSKLPSHQPGGLRERCKLSQRGPGRSPGNLEFGATWYLKSHNRNEKILSPWSTPLPTGVGQLILVT